MSEVFNRSQEKSFEGSKSSGFMSMIRESDWFPVGGRKSFELANLKLSNSKFEKPKPEKEII